MNMMIKSTVILFLKWWECTRFPASFTLNNLFKYQTTVDQRKIINLNFAYK